MARRSFVLISLITLQILQVFGNDGKGCEVRRVPRSDPAAPNMIKFSIECSNPQPDDQISAPSDVARAVVEPPRNSPYKSKFDPKSLKLTSPFKKRLADPSDLVGSQLSRIKLPFTDPKTSLQKFRSIFKKAPEENVPVPDKLFELPQDIVAALPKPKTSLSELLKKSKVPTFRTLDTASSNMDPIRAFRNQRPRFPSLFKKAAEEPAKPADLETLDDALKNTKLTLPHIMAQLLKKNPDDAMVSAAADVQPFEDAPKSSKFRESKLYSLLKKPEEDPIVSASSDSAAFEKLPKFEKLKLPKFRSLLKKNEDEPEVSASSLVRKFAESPQLPLLSPLEKEPEEFIKTSLADKLAALRKAPEDTIKKTISEKLAALRKTSEDLRNNVDEPEGSASSLVNKFADAPQLSKLSALEKIPEESLKPSLSDKLAALRKAPEESNKTMLSEKLAALKKAAGESYLLKKNDDDPIVSASSQDNKFAEAPKLSKLSELRKTQELKTSLSDKLAALRRAPEESIKTALSDKLATLKKGPEDSIKNTLSERLAVLKKAAEESSLLKKSDKEPEASASSQVNKFAEAPQLSKLSALEKVPEESLKTSLSDKLAALRKAPEESIKTKLSEKLAALRKTAEESSLLKKNDDDPVVSASSQVNKFADVPKLSELSELRKAQEESLKTSLSDKLAVLRRAPEESFKTADSIKTKLSDKLAALRNVPEEPIKPDIPAFLESSKIKTGVLADKVRSFLRKPDDDPVVSQIFDTAEKPTKPTKLSELLKRVSKERAGSESENFPARSPLKTLLERTSNKEMETAASDLEPKKSKLSSLIKKPLLPKKSFTLDKDPIVKSSLLSKLPPKIETPKARTAEEMTTMLDRIRNTLSEAVVNGKMDPSKGRSLLKKLSLTKDLDEGASEINSVAAETDQAVDAEKSASNTELVGSAPEDDMIGLTQKELDSKSCDLCKCFMKVFPQKFADGTSSRAASEVEEKAAKPPKFKRPILPSKISDRLREVLKPIDSDSSVDADNPAPSFLPAPKNREADGLPAAKNREAEGSDNELMEIERGERIQEGIERLINFVSLVGELDQYVSHKTRNFITKMARLYDGEERPQLL